MCTTEKMIHVSTRAIFTVICVMITLTSSDRAVCHDVAVVGGGVVGGYAVWRLRKQGLNVGLYEFSNRLGGRLYTHHFSHAPDIPIEIGAMRFSMNQHPILYHTVKEVGLKTQTLADLDTNASNKTIYFLRGKHLQNKDFNENHVPYNLRAHENRGILDIYRFLTQKTNFSGDASLLTDELHFLVSDDGVRLTNQSFQHFLKKYLSAEAIEIISNVDKFSIYNRNAADALRDKVVNISLPIFNMTTIVGGMQQLPERFVKEFLSANRKHSLHMNHQLVNITKTRDVFTLGFIKTRTVDGKTSPTSEVSSVCSRRVILAVPSTALRQISSEILQKQNILSNLNTVNYHYGVKLFLAYAYPWWRESPCKTKSRCFTSKSYDCQKSCPKSDTPSYKYRRGETGPMFNSDLPLDMTFDYGFSNKTGTAVLLAAYSLNGMWSDLQKHGDYIGQGYHRVSTEVVRHAHLYLARLFNIPLADIPSPIDAFVSRWDAYPYGAPFCTSKAGVDSGTVWKNIRKPSDIDDLFVASGPYSKRMSDAWSEYGLEAMKEIIDEYF